MNSNKLRIMVVVSFDVGTVLKRILREELDDTAEIYVRFTLAEAEKLCAQMETPCDIALIDEGYAHRVNHYRFGDGCSVGNAPLRNNENGCRVYYIPVSQSPDFSFRKEHGFDAATVTELFAIRHKQFTQNPLEFVLHLLADYKRYVKQCGRRRACSAMLSNTMPIELVGCGYANHHVAYRQRWKPHELPHADTLEELYELLGADELLSPDGSPVFFRIGERGQLT